jgi:rhamnulokinase
MPARIRTASEAGGQAQPESPAAVVRCILDSLAVAYARTINAAEQLSGQVAEVVHIVGGGCQNELLCQLTADLSGRPVLSGPVEATALGNVAVQARAVELLPATLDDLRVALSQGLQLQSYAPLVRTPHSA